MTKTLYRYEIEYRSFDNDTDVRLREFQVVRETEKTYFIKDPQFGWLKKEKRILKDAHNTYAFADKEDAKAHFIRRTQKRIAWYEFWTKECEKAIKIINGEDPYEND